MDIHLNDFVKIYHFKFKIVPDFTPSSENSKSPFPANFELGSQPSGPVDTKSSTSGIQAPTITLPRGGGAIRGIDEKFSANPVTGTGSISVPIPTSPGRSGFGPQMSLSYDSAYGIGNVFGFGWSLFQPCITRKTDKGLPQYDDLVESDVFILSGSEDLVPSLVFQAGKWTDDNVPNYTIDLTTFMIRRYRPRIEGLFAKIERWTNINDPSDVHWRSISKDNVLTLYGLDSESRIYDTSDKRKIFSWLISETRDDKGNGVLYRYKPEDGVGINGFAANEANRGPAGDARRTTNRYLKYIYYGNRIPLIDSAGDRPPLLDKSTIELQILNHQWMFTVVFDYGEHSLTNPAPLDPGNWQYRFDPFSNYRSGFEVRTTRLCQRILMFHHFTGEPEVGNDCLVNSMDFNYSADHNNVYTFLQKLVYTAYKRNSTAYDKQSKPPLEFNYSQPIVQGTVENVDPDSLENLPVGVDGSTYHWTDLHGEGIPGILTEQAGAWFYKRNISPASNQPVEFSAMEEVRVKPNISLSDGAQFMDLAGDGQLDLVSFHPDKAGFLEHDKNEGWNSFRPFSSQLNHDINDPNLRFVDLDGDGHTDILVTGDDIFLWYRSLAEKGFDHPRRVSQARDEESGPRLLFANGSETIYLADMTGDGLSDLVILKNGSARYHPNLGYCRWGAKVEMDNAPIFDSDEQFDQKRILLADIDGTGTADLIYLHREGTRLYFNRSGNSWTDAEELTACPKQNSSQFVTATDLLGNGTACLVWSSPLPGDSGVQMSYVNLMGDTKPHLLTGVINNMGAETRVTYATSTKFYLQDKKEGHPWITKLPFPVQVVERVEIYDYISRCRFVTTYAYHHGYFDGSAEREFRGFGRVDQWDTQQLAVLTTKDTIPDDPLPPGINVNQSSHIPPVLTKTWYHTGAWLGRDRISNFFAGLIDDNDVGEYYPTTRSGDAIADAVAKANLLDDTVLPFGLPPEEIHEACRSLKGSMLRQEVYALDGSAKEPHPYMVTEQNFTIESVQPRVSNRHSVFFTHPREAISYHYERNPLDPRVSHSLTIDVDPFGNVLKSLAIGYGRQTGFSPLTGSDRDRQEQLLITYSENDVTIPVDDQYSWRSPLPLETRTYEITGLDLTGGTQRFSFDFFVTAGFKVLNDLTEIQYEEQADLTKQQKRLIECVRTRYRKNDLSSFLPVPLLESKALTGQTYKLALTDGLVKEIFVDSGQQTVTEINTILANEGKYYQFAGESNWWIPSGQIFFSAGSTDSALTELTEAVAHFYLPRRYRDPFHTNAARTEAIIDYDSYDLLLHEATDALGNKITGGERSLVLPGGTVFPAKSGNNYRVLQPWLSMDANRNRVTVAFDIFGMVAGTAVMGKPEDAKQQGDLIGPSFIAELSPTQISDFDDDPLGPIAFKLLDDASTRIVYDINRFYTSRLANPVDPSKWQANFAATITRETHVSDLPKTGQFKIQVGFSYSDGFGREIQKKVQAEPGPVEGLGAMVSPRWIGSGWTIFSNKMDLAVRQYEPFFSALADHRHHFEFAKIEGVSSILCYDPVGRVVATIHPDHTFGKTKFDPWQQTVWDVNDTVTLNPLSDDVLTGFLFYPDGSPRIPAADYSPTWYQLRTDPAKSAELNLQYPDPADDLNETNAALKAVLHADTPSTVHVDVLGRTFLTFADNGPDPSLPAQHLLYATRLELDIEGNQRSVRDAVIQAGDNLGRIVMQSSYDMLGNSLYQLSMEAGARWMLSDVTGKPIRAWDSRGHAFATTYDQLRRPLTQTVTGYTTDSDPRTFGNTIQFDQVEYGEIVPGAETWNLRTRIYRHFDTAGLSMNARLNMTGNIIAAVDFKGNVLHTTRWLCADYTSIPNWPIQTLEGESFESGTLYDALNRAVQSIMPHSSSPSASFNIVQPVFNEANLLERVDVWLDQATEPQRWIDSLTTPPSAVGVTNIDYNAKGQRTRIDYKNGTTTFYKYDPLTFRLASLYTRRGGIFTADSENPSPPPATMAAPDEPPISKYAGLQNLHYSYDPAGNITTIRDQAQQTVYFNNKRVEPNNEYTYDALYRLIAATGREHLGQTGNMFPHSSDDSLRIGLPQPGDGNAMGTYLESYKYDEVGNIIFMRHHRSDASIPDWVRNYTYGASSLIENGLGGSLLKTSNRLLSTTVSGSSPEQYLYDLHGNITRMPHLSGSIGPNIFWDFMDRLQKVDLGGGGDMVYAYDGAGLRVRKVWQKNPGLIEERIYLAGFEIFRKHAGAIGSNTAVFERETVHITDDKQRVALVENRTLGLDPGLSKSIRYQFGNHLGSSCLELDDKAQIVSYEEYSPYGNSTYQAVRSQTETAKRYRYTGKERDEESGFQYHDARYYATWLGRWTACDSHWLADGPNIYVYSQSNPTVFVDSTGNETQEPDEVKLAPFLSNSGASAAQYYADLAEEGDKQGGFLGGLKVFGGWTGGLFASLWTPETATSTALTLASAGIGSLAGAGALGKASFPIARIMAVIGSYEVGVSTIQAITGETSGAHVGDLLGAAAGNDLDVGRKLSPLERGMEGMNAVVGWASMTHSLVGQLRQPELYKSPAAYANDRSLELQKALPKVNPETGKSGSYGRITMSASVNEGIYGDRSVSVAASGKGANVRAPVREILKPSERVVVEPKGHGEVKNVTSAGRNLQRPVAVGAGRPTCLGCETGILESGATPASPTRSGNVYPEPNQGLFSIFRW
jgi:RHS repeat-associated protein